MKKKRGKGWELAKLFEAEANRAAHLMCMQIDIVYGGYENAMQSQFWYLYWHDEYIELFDKHHHKYWQLKLSALGLDTHV